ncbi:MAG: wax ester/triacylglycerol synthase domain-containing protein [Candidatus Nanopelagicales bacterium]
MDRLTVLDDTFVVLERDNLPMHIGSLMIFDGPPPEYEDLTAHMSGRLDQLPRYRQVLREVPLNLGRPTWQDDTHFSLEYHVRHTAVPHPGGDEQLRILAGRLLSQRLDMQRPLWEMWLIEGLAQDRFAILNKVHHAMVDGLSGADIMEALLDESPEPVDRTPSQWRPTPAAVHRVGGGCRRGGRGPQSHGPARASGQGPRIPPRCRAEGRLGAGRHPADRRDPGAHRGQSDGPARSAPAVGVGQRRPRRGQDDQVRLGWDRQRRDPHRDRQRFPGVPARPGGRPARSCLRAHHGARSRRGHPTRSPAATRSPSCSATCRWAWPTSASGSPACTQQMVAAKSSGTVEGLDSLLENAVFIPPALYAAAGKLAAVTPQPAVSTITTNVPGPQQQLYILSHPMRKMLPYVPLGMNQLVTIAIMSYNGELCCGITADYDQVPDVQGVAQGIERGLADLAAAAAERGAGSS